MTKEKNNKPSKELPLGFVDRQEKELLIRDFIISNIKESFQQLDHILTECTLSYCLAYNQKYINLIKIKIKIIGMQQ